MEIKKKIEIRSVNAKWFLEKKFSKNQPWIQIILVKISRLYKLASQKESIYAYMALSNVLQQISMVKNDLLKLNNEFEKLFTENKVDKSSFEMGNKQIYELRIGVSLSNELISLIELFDCVLCNLTLASKINLCKNRFKSFKKMSRNHEKIVGIFNTILLLKEKEFAEISIENYLNNDQVYLDASKIFGEITPAVLNAALSIDMFPRLASDRFDYILSKLKQKEL